MPARIRTEKTPTSPEEVPEKVAEEVPDEVPDRNEPVGPLITARNCFGHFLVALLGGHFLVLLQTFLQTLLRAPRAWLVASLCEFSLAR